MVSKLVSKETRALLRKNRKFWVSTIIVVFVISLGLLGPLATKYGPRTPAGTPRSPPTLNHPFGTDYFGYDVFAEVVYGIRVSLSVGVIAAIVATTIGVLLGMIAGLKGGWIDSLVEFATNTFLTIPSLLVILLITAYMGRREITDMGLLIGAFSWPWTARAVRSQVAALKASDYVSLSYLSGNSSFRVLYKDILPNIASYILLVFVIQFSGGILAVVTLEFLGMGAAEWSLGAILNLAVIWGAVTLDVWWWFFPGIIIVLLMSSLYILVISLEEVFNPRLRRE
ncbi:MAG: ABC transporter permease [Desulfurococcus sp.]|nr:ABC transporter permease [Desulfurococcus sp.]